jgi:gamma-glutamyltranspeptidase
LGNLPLARLLEPAYELAENGFPVSEVFARYWEVAEDLLRADEAAAAALLTDGRAPRPGEVFAQPDIADTLSAVAEGGADAFYNGRIARSMAEAAQRAGGYLAEADLAAHETLWVEPISTDYRGVRVYEIPPPGQGIAALEMLNILEGFDLAALDPLGADRVHLEVEAKKLAYGDLYREIGDPEFWRDPPVPTERLISKEYAGSLREKISPDRASVPSVEPPLGEDTTYLCAVDAEGNGCSFINSLYMGFGSGVVAPGTGVCLQNRGFSFRLDPTTRTGWPPASARCTRSSRPRHARGRPLGRLREHGRPDAAPGPRPGALEPHRPRDDPARGRGPPAPPPPRRHPVRRGPPAGTRGRTAQGEGARRRSRRGLHSSGGRGAVDPGPRRRRPRLRQRPPKRRLRPGPGPER